MIQKKVCMLGSFAVGKTSLVRRFVENMFSEKYLTTIGVKVDKKIVEIAGESITLIIWDISGENGYHQIQSSYLRGMSGYLMVVDKTRMSTLNVAMDVHQRVQKVFPDLPNILLMNKIDLKGQWDIENSTIDKLYQDGWDLVMTSAKTGENVDSAFSRLASKTIGK